MPLAEKLITIWFTGFFKNTSIRTNRECHLAQSDRWALKKDNPPHCPLIFQPAIGYIDVDDVALVVNLFPYNDAGEGGSPCCCRAI